LISGGSVGQGRAGETLLEKLDPQHQSAVLLRELERCPGSGAGQ
jgi:hypothetical protein